MPSFHAPDTPPLKVHWDATTGFPPLSDLLRTLRDVEPLDRALRASADAPAGERAAAFHALRNSQPYRLEFAHKGVDIYTPAVRREVAEALVAQLEARGVGGVPLPPRSAEATSSSGTQHAAAHSVGWSWSGVGRLSEKAGWLQ